MDIDFLRLAGTPDIQLCSASWQACAPSQEPAMSARRKYLIAAL
ncbi:MAG: thiol-disulfide isomerase, partial [Stutzerimonas stutzeri]